MADFKDWSKKHPDQVNTPDESKSEHSTEKASDPSGSEEMKDE